MAAMSEQESERRRPTQHRTKSRGNGEGSIYWFAKRQKWVGATTLDGKRKVVYAGTRQDAAKLLVKVQRDVQQGLPVPGARLRTERYLRD